MIIILSTRATNYNKFSVGRLVISDLINIILQIRVTGVQTKFLRIYTITKYYLNYNNYNICIDLRTILK